MEGQNNNNCTSKLNMTGHNKECGMNNAEFSGILIMTPETKLENPDQTRYRICGEKTPWIVKNMSGLEFPLITNEIDQKTLKRSISQDTCLTVVSDDIDSSRSDISTSNHQNNINENISQFRKWDNSVLERENENNNGRLLNEHQSNPRLPSGLDEYSPNSRDINDTTWSNSNHVYWDEDVKYYRYPLESSLSTIDVRSDQSNIEDLPRTQSQPYLLQDNYFTETNVRSSKQKNMLDTFWKEISDFENSIEYSNISKTKKNFKRNAYNHSDYNIQNSNKFTNIEEQQSINVNKENKYTEWNNEDLSQNQFKNEHTLATLNLEPHLNIENLETSKCHICNNPDSVAKQRSSKPNTQNRISHAKGVNQSTYRADNNAPIQSTDNYLEKSKNDICTYCEQYGNSHVNKEKLQTDKTENPSLVKRNKMLRELLGLKPEEKNVLVMLKL